MRSTHVLLLCVFAAGCGGDDGGDDSGDRPARSECERSVQSAPQLSTEVKDELLGICEEGAEGGPEAERAAIRRVCVRVIEESLPAGPAADQAKESCRVDSP